MGGWAWNKACSLLLPHRYYDSPDDNDWPLEGWAADTAGETQETSCRQFKGQKASVYQAFL